MSCKFNFKCVVIFIKIVLSLLLSRSFEKTSPLWSAEWGRKRSFSGNASKYGRVAMLFNDTFSFNFKSYKKTLLGYNAHAVYCLTVLFRWCKLYTLPLTFM